MIPGTFLNGVCVTRLGEAVDVFGRCYVDRFGLVWIYNVRGECCVPASLVSGEVPSVLQRAAYSNLVLNGHSAGFVAVSIGAFILTAVLVAVMAAVGAVAVLDGLQR